MIDERDYLFYGIYGGYVLSNIDQDNKGGLKVYVPSVYPDQLQLNYELIPWAYPAMSIFGRKWHK